MATDQNPKASPPGTGTGAATRSENLLPADSGADDGRFEVAEEVSLDQQSDSARRVGQAPAGPEQDAVAKTLQDRPAETPPDAP